MKLFLKSTVITFAGALALSACASVAEDHTPVPAAAHPASNVTAHGTFTGDSGHVTKGGVTVSRDDHGQWFITLGEDFSLDGGPDPHVELGAHGARASGADLGELKSLNGQQRYALAEGLDIGDYDRVYIWCQEFGVPLGHADLALN